MPRLSELRVPRERFARSINVERDANSNALDGYLPVGRAIEVIRRLANSLEHDAVECALSVTGPYGSGKSSLAVMVTALFGPAKDPARAAADRLLDAASPDVATVLREARRRLGADQHGFIRAVVTAQREPIMTTVLRALIAGAERFQPPPRRRAAHSRVVGKLRALRDRVGAGHSSPTVGDLRTAVAMLADVAPVLLLIDEFGKNLEAFAQAGAEADLFLLQELAEWSRGMPLALVTMQHLAFDEHIEASTSGRRREWAKIQGRFDDIAFIDSPTQSRALVAAAFSEPAPALREALSDWARSQQATLDDLGLRELATEPHTLEQCWPLHPLALVVLPELCERYGQNERTLFSFLTQADHGTAGEFLRETEWDGAGPPPTIRLDRIYNYFVESTATMVGVSPSASRLLEIDTRIRDTHGLPEATRRVLKTVGLLNLVAAGGTLRASKAAVAYAAADGASGTEDARAVERQLLKLEQAGLVSFRDFADEYRVWQGSDFDVRAAIDLARRRLRDQSIASVLERINPMQPIVAARHSHQTGALRSFSRGWIDSVHDPISPHAVADRVDGALLFVLGPASPVEDVSLPNTERPLVFATAADVGAVADAALELGAVVDALGDSDAQRDWVARRELIERGVQARLTLDQAFESTFGPEKTTWWWAAPGAAHYLPIDPGNARTASGAVSFVADAWYSRTAVIKNDLVNRQELSSQATKARRLLIESMIRHPDHPGLKIEGFGPDRTMYLSVLEATGVHRPTSKSPPAWAFVDPPDDGRTIQCRAVWEELCGALLKSTATRLRVSDLYERLARPPFGLRAGVAPILLVAALLVHSDQIAIYEHGTFRPILTTHVVERLLRNPGNFELKHFAAKTGCRAVLVRALAGQLSSQSGSGSNQQETSALSVVSQIAAALNLLPDYSRRTKQISSDAISARSVLLAATEPDRLLFEDLPIAFGKAPLPADGRYGTGDIVEIAERLGKALDELRDAYPRLLDATRHVLRERLAAPGRRLRAQLASRARALGTTVLDPQIAGLVAALKADVSGDREWIEYVAMMVSGLPAASWTDEDRTRFFARLHAFAATFRRVEALNAELRAHEEHPDDALRVTVTGSDGKEAAKLVWVDEDARGTVAPILEAALTDAGERLQSPAHARDTLLALLVESDLASEQTEAKSPIQSAQVVETSGRR